MQGFRKSKNGNQFVKTDYRSFLFCLNCIRADFFRKNPFSFYCKNGTAGRQRTQHRTSLRREPTEFTAPNISAEGAGKGHSPECLCGGAAVLTGRGGYHEKLKITGAAQKAIFRAWRKAFPRFQNRKKPSEKKKKTGKSSAGGSLFIRGAFPP